MADEASEFLISIIIEAIDRASPTLTKLAGEIEALKRASGSTGLEQHPTVAMQKGLEDTAASAQKLDTEIKKTTQSFGPLSVAEQEAARRADSLAASQKRVADSEVDLEAKAQKLASTINKLSKEYEQSGILSEYQHRQLMRAIADYDLLTRQMQASDAEMLKYVSAMQRGTDALNAYTTAHQENIAVLRQVADARASDIQGVQQQEAWYRRLTSTMRDLRAETERHMPVPFWGASGLPAWARLGLPVAGAGSIGMFAGFGAERMLMTMLGIGGSAVGGLAGGGLLGGAALASTAVGAGSDIAVMRSTISDTRTLYQQYQQLQQAVAVYGAHSQQAAQQQALLNFQMRQLGPASGVELALAKQVGSLNTLWDRMTTRARETSVGILSEFVKLARDYVPLVANAAERNLSIINRAINTAPSGQMSLMAFLRGPAEKYFKDLEDIFAKRLPTSVHAFTQALELAGKIIDYVATHFLTGKFTEAVDKFFTKWNDPQNWGRVKDLVGRLIHDFEVWKNFLEILAKDIYQIFHGAAKSGTAIVQSLTDMLKKLHEWLISTSGQQQLRTIFTLHKEEILAILQIIPPLVEGFGKLYLAISPVLIQMVIPLIQAFSGFLNLIVNIGNELSGPFKTAWSVGVLAPFGAFLIAWKTWNFQEAVSRFRQLGSLMFSIGTATMGFVRALMQGQGLMTNLRLTMGQLGMGGGASAATPASTMEDGIISGSKAGAEIMSTAIVDAISTGAGRIGGTIAAAGSEAGGQMALFEMAGAGVPGAAGAVGGAASGEGEAILAGAGVGTGAASRAMGLVAGAARFAGLAALAYGGFRAAQGFTSIGTSQQGLASVLGPIPSHIWQAPGDVSGFGPAALGARFGSALTSIPFGIGDIFNSVFGSDPNQTTAALQQLQGHLKGISSPAQLSSDQLGSLRAEIQRVSQMPDLTARQRAGLHQLAIDFNPVHAAIDQYKADFQSISPLTGNIMTQVEQIVATHTAAMSQNITRGSQDWYTAIKGNYGAAIATLEQLNQRGYLSTDKMVADINNLLNQELQALGAPGLSRGIMRTLGPAATRQALTYQFTGGAGITSGMGHQGRAQGGYENATPGGRVIQVAEGGYPEVVLTTDPSYAPRQRQLLAQYLRAAPSVMGFQAGGIVPTWTGPGGEIGAIGQDVGSIVAQAANAMLGYAGMGGSLTGVTGSMGPTGGFPVNVPGSLTNWLTRGMQVAGVSGPLWLPMLQRQAMRESSGNPSSVNRWDVNAQRGDPSEGLLQTTLSTFATYHVPGYGNILNPVDNTAAAIRYMIATYGHGSSQAAAQVMWARGGGAYQPGGWAFQNYSSAQAFFNSFPPNQMYTAVNPVTGRRQTMTNRQWSQLWANLFRSHHAQQQTAATSRSVSAPFTTPMRGHLMYSPAGSVAATHQFAQHDAAAYAALQQAEATALQNAMTGIQDTLGTAGTGLQDQMAGMQTLGTYGIRPGQSGYSGGDVVTRSLVANARAQIARYTDVMKKAQAEGQRDIAAQAKQQIDQLNESITQYTAGLLQAQITYFNQQAQYETNQLQRQSRLAQVLAKGPQFVGGMLGTTLAAQAQLNVLTGTRQSILGQLGTLGGFLGQAEQQGNVGLSQQIRDQMDELNTQLKENTQAISDQTVAIQQTTIDFINARTQFQTGVYGGLFSALQTAGQLTGSLNVPLATNILTANQGALQGGLGGLLGSLASGYGINLTSLANNPTGLIQALSNLPYGQIEQGMSAAQVTQFEGLISSISQNVGALEQNTVQLQQLNGQLLQPQQFSSSAWQMFRTAIFTGMGGLLPTYAGIPGLSPGTATGMPMPGINTTINPGSSPVVGGDFNLNVMNPSTVLDPQYVMSTAAFALKTQT